MEFRHELHRTISPADAITLEHRIAAVTMKDGYGENGTYSVHSLYFSDGSINSNEQFLIRYYNGNTGRIILEKISGKNEVSYSESCEITADFVRAILDNDFGMVVRDPLGRSGDNIDELIQEFYWKVVGTGLRPKQIVDFKRKSLPCAYGNVKIYMDSDRGISFNAADFLNPDHARDLIRDDVELTVKWESYLPDMIRSAVSLAEHRYSFNTIYERQLNYV